LLGLGGTAGVAREEQFTAWARYLRSMAGSGTAVIALEDIHWADPALLAFLDVLTEPSDAALLVVLTTRPSIADVAPHLGTRAERPVRLELGPLTNEETQALVVGVLGSIVPGELHAPILERSRGNPLYAEELVRLLGDRDLLERMDGIIRLRPGVTIPLPETIHGLLASRLDAVPEAERSVLSRAAIVGATFWPAAMAAIGGSAAADVRGALDALEGRQLVRRHEPSSLAGEDEFEFWHVLLRDVAYEALPRRERIDGHLATVDWIEATSGHRGDVAGIVAHHLSTAYELAVAIGDRTLVDTLRPRARRALAAAAEAASSMDGTAALALYRRALDLATDDDWDRAVLLLGYGRVADRSGRTGEAIAALDDALAVYETTGRGDTVEAASVLIALRPPLMAALDLRWQGYTIRALEILEPHGPSPLLVEALIGRAWLGMWATPPVEAGTYADRALAVAASANLPTPVEALAIRGQARMYADSPAAGFADFDLAFETALARGEWERAAFIAQNYAGYLYFHHGVARCDALSVRALEICEAHGLKTLASWHRISHASALTDLGRLDEAEALMATISDDVSASGNRLAAYFLLGIEAAIALIRDDRERLRVLLPTLDTAADGDNSDGIITDVVIHAARAHERLGDRDRARDLLVSAMGADRAIDRYWLFLAPMTRLALDLGDLELAASVTAGVASRSLVQRLGHRTNAALLAEAGGKHEEGATAFREVAVGWAEFGIPLESALAHLGAGRCLAAVGSVDAAREQFDDARALFAMLKSPRLVASVPGVDAAVEAPGKPAVV
jgi:tetratricopeptide (TPR) repeat protein